MSVPKATVESMPWTCRRCGQTMPLREQLAHLEEHGAEARQPLTEQERIEARG